MDHRRSTANRNDFLLHVRTRGIFAVATANGGPLHERLPAVYDIVAIPAAIRHSEKRIADRRSGVAWQIACPAYFTAF